MPLPKDFSFKTEAIETIGAKVSEDFFAIGDGGCGGPGSGLVCAADGAGRADIGLPADCSCISIYGDDGKVVLSVSIDVVVGAWRLGWRMW